MRIARDFAADEVAVNLVTTQYPEDHDIIPDYFDKTPDLQRSVLDLGQFEKKRKLPLIADILDRAASHDHSADYIIYTNCDIALMPHFYRFIKFSIEKGHDAFVINRRTIPGHITLDSLSEAFALIGKSHPGFDCFVIKRALLAKFELGEVIIGASKIGITVLANMMAHAREFKLYEHQHLTFHIGEDQVWQNPALNDYFMHNCREAKKVYDGLLSKQPELLEHYHKLASE